MTPTGAFRWPLPTSPAVNPNTGTAPIFRSRRDADITRRIYERHPVLVDRSGGDEVKAWPVRYMQGIFNMTADSHLFRTADHLEEEGFYPVQGNRWKRGKELYLPLYQGRMIQHFDHRASSVRVNPESTRNPYLSEETSDAQHRDPDFSPTLPVLGSRLGDCSRIPEHGLCIRNPTYRQTDRRSYAHCIDSSARWLRKFHAIVPQR